MSTAEAEVNPDGSTTFESPDGSSSTADGGSTGETFEEPPFAEGESPMEDDQKTDPAIYLGVFVIVMALMFVLYQLYASRKRKQLQELTFFSEVESDKFDLKLPAAVDEYYATKEKCIEQGWEAGKPPANAQEAQNGPHRVLAQALMKRCIADIPLVQHIQKESTGMNKLYAQSMCSVTQWRMYQAAENMVSSEVEDVRAEADEIEPGWSQMIWRQAMQYHSMLKNKHEQEAKAMAQASEKKKLAAEEPKKPQMSKEELAKAKAAAAEKAAQELIKQEEREKNGKKAFSGGAGMKKGFLDKKDKKK